MPSNFEAYINQGNSQMTETIDPPTPDRQSTLRAQARVLLERLTQTYPAAFLAFGKPQVQPLKLGIHKELQPIVFEWGYDRATLKYALGMYTRQLRYQLALIRCKHRIDLEGESGEEISQANRQTAQEKVDLIQEKRRKTQATHSPKRAKKTPAKAAVPNKGVSEQALAALKEKLTGKT